jgi:signal transduction histidine kinase
MARKGNKYIEIMVKVEPTTPIGLVADDIKLCQVIINLITNAIKFTDKGYVELEINYEKIDDGINLCVKVKDTGIGIKPENLDKLFNIFYSYFQDEYEELAYEWARESLDPDWD